MTESSIRSRRPANLVLAILAIASVSYSLVQSMVNPALQSLRAEVHTDQLGISWVLTAFLLASAVLTPVLGRLGDQIGRRGVIVGAIAALAIGSLIGGLAQDLPLLVVARVLQGAGGATLPLAFGILRNELPPARVAGSVGLVASVSAVGGSVGVLLAGPIIDGLGSRWLFLLPAIVNAIVAIALALCLPRSRAANTGGMNWAAAVLLSATLVALLLPVTLGSTWGWGSPFTIALFVLAVVLGVIWVRIELGSSSPLIDMRVFAMRPVWTANLASFLFGVALYSAFGFVPAFVQVPASAGYGFGASVTISGLVFVPMTVTMLITGLLAGRLLARFPAKALLMVTGIFPIIAFLLLAFVHEQLWEVAVATAIGGIGFGIALAALSTIVVQAVPASSTGAAAGMNANIRTIGGAVGAAVISVILSSATPAGTFIPTEAGYTTTFIVLAGCAAVGLLASALVSSHRGPVLHADRPEEELDRLVAEVEDQSTPI
jgi:EmrB/QacA subfamily drug resistance transporter